MSSRKPTCLCGECRKCKHRVYMSRWYAENREHVSESKKVWYAKNADKVRNSVKKYRDENIEKIRAYDRARGHRSYGEEKDRARKLVYRAILRGDLNRSVCEVCGDPKTDAHHPDYSRPLDVRWLCRMHHMELHRKVAA